MVTKQTVFPATNLGLSIVSISQLQVAQLAVPSSVQQCLPPESLADRYEICLYKLGQVHIEIVLAVLGNLPPGIIKM